VDENIRRVHSVGELEAKWILENLGTTHIKSELVITVGSPLSNIDIRWGPSRLNCIRQCDIGHLGIELAYLPKHVLDELVVGSDGNVLMVDV